MAIDIVQWLYISLASVWDPEFKSKYNNKNKQTEKSQQNNHKK